MRNEKRAAMEVKCQENLLLILKPRKLDIRLPGKGNLNSHGARPVY